MSATKQNNGTGGKNGDKETPQPAPPNNPEKYIPIKEDDDNDATRPKPGVNDPKKVDPTRIEEPGKIDPTRKDNK